VKRPLAVAVVAAALALQASARADEPPPAAETPAPPVQANVDLTRDTKPAADEARAPDAPPPPPPYRRTVVLDSSIGALAFLGQFGKVAPPAPWLHAQLGIEIFRWLMLYGEGELAFTDTGNRQPPPTTRAFPLFGFGGGARFTVRVTERVGIYVQGGLGAMKAEIAENALGILGFRDAESLAPYFGGRVGVEWFQLDRHFALGIAAGARLAQGFARDGIGQDTPAAIDAAASIRYAF